MDLRKTACEAGADELKELFRSITGKDLPDEKVQLFMGACKLEGVEFQDGKMKARLETIENLKRSVREEQQAQHDYRVRAQIADVAEDVKSAELWRHIAGEERQHEKEFTARFLEEYK